MNIPDRVRVGAVHYTVTMQASLARSADAFGQMDPLATTITLDATANPQRRESTFVHELFEAMNNEYHIELQHGQIYQLAVALHQVVKDNPAIFASEQIRLEGLGLLSVGCSCPHGQHVKGCLKREQEDEERASGMSEMLSAIVLHYGHGSSEGTKLTVNEDNLRQVKADKLTTSIRHKHAYREWECVLIRSSDLALGITGNANGGAVCK